MEPSFSASEGSSSSRPEGAASSAGDEILLVNFRCIDGRTFSLELPADIDIADVISLVADEVDWPSNRVRLIYHGRGLTTGTTLQSYDVKSEHTIHVVRQQAPSPEGGASSGGESRDESEGTGPAAAGASTASGSNAGALGSTQPGLTNGTGAAGPMWTPISLPGGGTMMVGHMQFPAHVTMNLAPQQTAPQQRSGTGQTSAPGAPGHHGAHGPNFLANSISQAVSAVAASVSSAAHAAAAATSAAQAASNAVAAFRGRAVPALSASLSSSDSRADGSGSREEAGASGRGESAFSTGASTTRGGSSSAAVQSPFASPRPHAGLGTGATPAFSTLLRREGASGTAAGGPSSSGPRRAGVEEEEEPHAGGSSERTPETEFYLALAGALESAAHSLLRAADRVRQEARSQISGSPGQESSRAASATPTHPSNSAVEAALPGQATEATGTPPSAGETGDASQTRNETGAERGARHQALQTPLLQMIEQPTVALPGGLTAHVLPVAVHVTVDPRSRSEEGSGTSFGTREASAQRREGMEGAATVDLEPEQRRPRAARPRELMITHEFVQRLLPWTELRDTLEVIHRERGWTLEELPRVSTQTGAPPPLSVFLPSFVSALNLVAAMLQQFMGWQQGVARMSVPAVGRSALALARLSATTAGLSALLTSIFNSMASHVDATELAAAMEWHTDAPSDASPGEQPSGQAAASAAPGGAVYAAEREEREGQTLRGPLRAGETSRGPGSGDRRRRESEGEEAESRGRRRVETSTAGGLGLRVMQMRGGDVKDERECEEELDSSQERRLADDVAAAFGEGSSPPVSPSSSRASPRASAPSVVSLTSSNAATAGSSSSSTEPRDAFLAAVTGGASLSSLTRSPLGAGGRDTGAGPSLSGNSVSYSPTSIQSARPGFLSSAADRKEHDDDSFPSSASLSADPDLLSEAAGAAQAGRGADGPDADCMDGVEEETGPSGLQGLRGSGVCHGAQADSVQNLLCSLGRALPGESRNPARDGDGFGGRGEGSGRDAAQEDEAIDEDVRMRLQMWTGNSQQFSRNVLAYARPHPFSSAYRSGDVTQSSSMRSPTGEAVENVLSLSWHRALNRVNVGEEPRPPASLAPSYLALLMREATTSARNNNDFAMQQDRFPHIRLALQLLQDAERPPLQQATAYE
ncbi:ubiquitin family protein [Toxoplasma gondii TgCatPRC2]|uniref:Ubiquitin family protein n=1 Tax=Toxoplasma gondii TgCatPRC2 TaxID=1130821 RepID=A0A151HH60_TOXGO|nr:ubiquitin family protein [Toxoplasma gondii TgCatPRC2]